METDSESEAAHSYILLKHKGEYCPRGLLVENNDGRYTHHSHRSYGTQVSTSADPDDIAPLTEGDCRILDPIISDIDRYAVYSTPGKLAWGVKLKVGDTVLVKLPPYDNSASGGEDTYATAIIRWYGNVEVMDEKYMFGVEIIEEKYRGCGTCDGKYGEGVFADEHFSCKPKCGLFLSLDMMKPLSPPPEATAQDSVTLLEKRPKSRSQGSEHFSTTEGRKLRRDIAKLRGTIKEKDTQIERLQEELKEKNRELREKEAAKNREVQRMQGELREKTSTVSRLYTRIETKERTLSSLQEKVTKQKTELLQAKQEIERNQRQLREEQAQHQQLASRINIAVAHLRGEGSAPQHALQLWELRREDIQVSQTILGTGGWGYVARGTFQGQPVAVKCLHHGILSQRNESRVKREISIMAQVRHPNLLLLIGAVLNVEGARGPMIVTELLDKTLRLAYEKGSLMERSKLPVLRDVASALTYLHSHRTPFIHRDVSSANVLLESISASSTESQWKAKLSDFGSANLSHLATTPAEGAAVYAAPEVSTEDRSRQTPKIDVYSFGVLACEVCLCRFPPERREFPSMLREVQGAAPNMFPLARDCTSQTHQERPIMREVLQRINHLIVPSE